MYTLEDVYKTFPSGCTEDYKIRRAFEMGKQTREKQIEIDAKQIRALQKQNGELTDRVTELEKENAELKKLKRECETSLCRAEYQYNYEQLTKAKNLLQKVADVCGYPNYDIPVVLYSEIADFLKDGEVEK
jgi:DNA repair exonuclease SbcCD ATPase subunit